MTEPVQPAEVAPVVAAPAAVAPAVASPPAIAAAPVAPAAPVVAAPTRGAFEPTGDPGLDTALDFAAGLGLGTGDPAIEAAKAGDFTALEAAFRSKGDAAKGWERMLALGKQAYERATKEAAAKTDETTAAVYAAVGGEATWNAISTWAASVATPAEKEDINASLAAGGLRAKLAAQYLVQQFTKAGRPGAGKAPATQAAAPAGVVEAAPLTAREYANAVDALSRANAGRDVAHMPEYQALRARRQAARSAGR